MRIPLTRYAVPEILLFVSLFAGATVAAWVAFPLALPIPLGLLVFTLNFFRDPDRPLTGDDATLISPADGTVADIVRVPRAPFIDGPAHRIGIFLSVFDVHVNRVPLGGTVAHVEHRPGAFLDARDPRCAVENEAVDLGLDVVHEGRPLRILVRQVAGLIARRIICATPVGTRLSRGERYGMIRFGSRTEVYVPETALDAFTVKVGDKVKGGLTVLGTLRRGGGKS